MRLVIADTPEADNTRVWLNFREVTALTFEAELGRWPYVPTWSKVGMYVQGDDSRIKAFLIDGEMRPKIVYRHGLVW